MLENQLVDPHYLTTYTLKVYLYFVEGVSSE